MRIEEGGAAKSPQRKGGPVKGKKEEVKKGGRGGKGGQGTASKKQEAQGARKTGPVKEIQSEGPPPASNAAA